MHQHEYEAIHSGAGQAFKLLTEDEAAECLGVSKRHLQRLVASGEGPPRVQLGLRRVGYPVVELAAWVRARTRTAPANA